MNKNFWRQSHLAWVLPVLASATLACSVFGANVATPTPTAFVPPTLAVATDTAVPGPSPTTEVTTAPVASDMA